MPSDDLDVHFVGRLGAGGAAGVGNGASAAVRPILRNQLLFAARPGSGNLAFRPVDPDLAPAPNEGATVAIRL